MTLQVRKARYHGGVIIVEIGPLATRVQSIHVEGRADGVDITFHGAVLNNSGQYSTNLAGLLNEAKDEIDAWNTSHSLLTQRTAEVESALDEIGTSLD